MFVLYYNKIFSVFSSDLKV